MSNAIAEGFYVDAYGNWQLDKRDRVDRRRGDGNYSGPERRRGDRRD